MSKNTKTRLRTVVSAVTAFATVFTLSGVMVFVPFAGAQTISEGDLIRTTGTFDIYIVKLMGAKKFKRLILNPEIFNSYGHLSWGSVKDVSAATMAEYTNTNLVIEVDAAGAVVDPKVYAVTSAADSDTGERRHLNVTAAEFTAAGLDWDSIYKVNHTEASPSFYPTMTALTATDNLVTWSTNVNGGGTTVPAGAGVSVSLAADSPGAQGVAQSATGRV